MMTFNKWLDTMIEEKGIDLEESFQINNDWMYYGNIVEYVKLLTVTEQKKFRDQVVKIDFENGDLKRFLRCVGEMMQTMYQL